MQVSKLVYVTSSLSTVSDNHDGNLTVDTLCNIGTPIQEAVQTVGRVAISARVSTGGASVTSCTSSASVATSTGT